MSDFFYTDLLPAKNHQCEFEKIASEGIQELEYHNEQHGTKTYLSISPNALQTLSYEAIKRIQFFLRSEHLMSLKKIYEDPQSSENDKFVALDLLKNAITASEGILPMCQDTGTALVLGKRGVNILTQGVDEENIARGIYNAYQDLNLRYSQMAPLTMWEEKNTGNNLPAQIEIYANSNKGDTYEFLFIAKGGGSANKSFLYQETKALLNKKNLLAFFNEKLRELGTAACPPYHLAIVIGGTSAEFTLKTAKLASTKYLDNLPSKGSITGHAFRDHELEAEILKLTQEFGIGAQFGGKHFCHDVRVIRLPRHGASLPVAVSVSCSADRQVLAKITREGMFIEKLETNPKRFLPDIKSNISQDETIIKINIDQPMGAILNDLSKHPIKTKVSLTGTMIVARDIAHARILEKLNKGEPLPSYMQNHPIYYAGPAKKPDGKPSGSFGPTTSGRMDSYVETFQKHGGSKIMIAKGNRSKAVVEACKTYGGFYLGSIGGSAARLAEEAIKKVEVLDFEDLGMEAVWKIEVQNFPAFIIIDDKGNDFFESTLNIIPLSTIENISKNK